jgi:hypothetical protein
MEDRAIPTAEWEWQISAISRRRGLKRQGTTIAAHRDTPIARFLPFPFGAARRTVSVWNQAPGFHSRR